uniref:Uncharacterized protein n=1 Tax=Meleagris gallopavo TaxID=9103 RepID=G1MR31_MELGA
GHIGVVEILLDKGGDIEAQSERTKDTPLSLACSGGRQEVQTYLSLMNLTFLVVFFMYKLFFFILIVAGSFSLLPRGKGIYFLHWSFQVVDLLLARGANKEHRNVSDYTPLSLAASGGYVNIIKILLNAGHSLVLGTAVCFFLTRTGSKLGISPLMLAAMNGHVPAVKLLLDMGSDINAQIETNRNTALTLACFQGRAEVVSLLLDRKANVEHRAKTGLTPLMEAASGGYAEVGRVLLDKGADVNAPPVPSSRDTALTIAADKGHYKFSMFLCGKGTLVHAASCILEQREWESLEVACCICSLLFHLEITLGSSSVTLHATKISRGSHIDVRNKKGNTPLWLAANGGHYDVVQLLVQAGADEHESEGGRTPLMKAARAGHLCTVQFLISKGKILIVTVLYTMVSLACAGGHLAVVELLLAHGADPTHRLKDGSTMLIEAAKGGHTNVVSYLLDYPNNVLPVPSADLSQLTPPSQDQTQVPRVPVHTLAMVVPPQEPDRTPQENSPPLVGVVKGASKQKSSSLQVADKDLLPPFHPYQPLECIVEETEGKLNELGQRISAIEKAQLKSLELIQGEPLNKDKIEELKKNREEQVQKKKKILKELQKVERQLQMKTQQQFTKEYLETKGQTDTPLPLQQQCPLTGVFPEVEADKGLPEDNFSELPQVDTILSKDDEQQHSPPPAEQIEFVPIQPLPASQCNFSGNLGYNGTESLELQKAIGNQQNVGQQQQIAGQGLLVQEPDGLMVATPAQTLTDTLDDLIAGGLRNIPMFALICVLSFPFLLPSKNTLRFSSLGVLAYA